MRNASVVYVVRNDRDDKLSGPFGRLTVTGPAVRKGSNYVVPVRCDCGETLTVQRNNLVSGRTKSCGCLHREQAAVTGRANRRHEKAPRRPSTRPRRTHGGSRTRAYFSWRGMQQRCTNPRDKSFARYGGRGIRVCARWQSFELFLADMGERPARTTIDRIDNERGYECGRSECADCGPLGRTCNGRWATPTQQQRNRSNTHRVTVDGAQVAAAELYSQHGVSAQLFRERTLHMGWSPLRAATTPPRSIERSA